MQAASLTLVMHLSTFLVMAGSVDDAEYELVQDVAEGSVKQPDMEVTRVLRLVVAL